MNQVGAMLGRLFSSRIADRRDVGLFTVAGLVLIAFTIVWALFLAQLTIPIIGQKVFMLLVVLGFSLLAGLVPYLTWGRGERRPIASFMVRVGLAMQIFGLLITPIGLLYETNPVISVPIGFAAFLTVFFGVFVSGFGGNMLAPPRA
ncbi:MAG TPA: hypothetical protein VFZ66_19375 [Herpetosiphonaceae bacterium]